MLVISVIMCTIMSIIIIVNLRYMTIVIVSVVVIVVTTAGPGGLLPEVGARGRAGGPDREHGQRPPRDDREGLRWGI